MSSFFYSLHTEWGFVGTRPQAVGLALPSHLTCCRRWQADALTATQSFLASGRMENRIMGPHLRGRMLKGQSLNAGFFEDYWSPLLHGCSLLSGLCVKADPRSIKEMMFFSEVFFFGDLVFCEDNKIALGLVNVEGHAGVLRAATTF